MEEKGSKMEVIFLNGGGGKRDFAAVFSHEINRIPYCKMGIVGNILDRGMRPSRVFKR